MKANVFTQEKQKSRRYSIETISDADYADDLELLANTPVQADSLLHTFPLVKHSSKKSKTHFLSCKPSKSLKRSK